MRLRGFLKIALAGVFSLSILFFAGLLKNPYGKGSVVAECLGREYYLYSPSSQAKIVKRVGFADCFFLTGERSDFLFSSEREASGYVFELLDEQNATVVFEEEIMGARSIYAYAPNCGNGILLSGKRVNLHLVVKGDCVCVGTPIVFGGY